MFDDHPAHKPVDDPTDVAAELAELGLTEAELDAALEADGDELPLAQLWQPDDHMVERVTASLSKRLTDREALRAVAELGGLGWFTLKALFSDQN